MSACTSATRAPSLTLQCSPIPYSPRATATLSAASLAAADSITDAAQLLDFNPEAAIAPTSFFPYCSCETYDCACDPYSFTYRQPTPVSCRERPSRPQLNSIDLDPLSVVCAATGRSPVGLRHAF